MFDVSEATERASGFGAMLIAFAIADGCICIIGLNIYAGYELIKWLAS